MPVKRVPLKLGWKRPRPKRWVEIDTDTGQIVRRDDWHVHDEEMRRWLDQQIDNPTVPSDDDDAFVQAYRAQSSRIRRELNLNLEWEEKPT